VSLGSLDQWRVDGSDGLLFGGWLIGWAPPQRMDRGGAVLYSTNSSSPS
jgi:hypothetical protein